ncbi:hypothetical protein TNCV_3258141 [Trichonephila clavipes]|nr:hypothetical protein TNCV_3258141 [Trichonephila clavipes]
MPLPLSLSELSTKQSAVQAMTKRVLVSGSIRSQCVVSSRGCVVSSRGSKAVCTPSHDKTSPIFSVDKEPVRRSFTWFLRYAKSNFYEEGGLTAFRLTD